MPWYVTPDFHRNTIYIQKIDSGNFLSPPFNNKKECIRWFLDNKNYRKIVNIFLVEVYSLDINNAQAEHMREDIKNHFNELSEQYAYEFNHLSSESDPAITPAPINYNDYLADDYNGENRKTKPQFDKASILKQLGLDDEEIKKYMTESKIKTIQFIGIK